MRLVQDLVLFVCLFTLLGSQLPDTGLPVVALWEQVDSALASLR